MRAERLLEAVRALAPLVEAERARLDRERALSPGLVDALGEAGLFRLWAPRRLGGAEGGAGGRPTTRLVFVPVDGARIHDTWRVSGLRGTGSHDYSLDGVMVPAAHTIDAFADEPTRSERLYAYPVIPFVTGAVGAVPIGIARGAIEELTRLARTRKRAGRPLAEDATVPQGIARAEIHARPAERLPLEAVDDMWRTVKRGKPAALEQRAPRPRARVNPRETPAPPAGLRLAP